MALPFRVSRQLSSHLHHSAKLELDSRLISCVFQRLQGYATAQPQIENNASNYMRSELKTRNISPITGNENADKTLHALSGGRISIWMQKYEDFVGLTEVKEAQSNVMQAEGKFRDVQTERRRLQQEMTDVHSKLKDLHAAIDKVQRGDERYLALLTEEYEIIREEKRLAERVAVTEQSERDQFAALSSAVRESHEKERSRAERTKYWSVIGSVIGAAIGIIGTTINNRMRMKELKGIVRESTEGGTELKSVVAKLADSSASQYNQLQIFMSELKQLVGVTSVASGSLKSAAVTASSSTQKLEEQTEEILTCVKEQDKLIGREMNEIRKLLVLQQNAKMAESETNSVVYVGPEVESLLSRTEENLEWKLKVNALMVASLLYGAGALTLYALSRGATS